MFDFLKQQTASQFAIVVLMWLAVTALVNLVAHRSQVDAWCEKRPKLAAVLKLMRGLGLDPWLLVQGLTLLLKGRLPSALRNSTPVLGVVAIFTAALLLTGCPGTTEQRQICYAQVELKAAQRAQEECGDADWEACPARPAILEDLRASYRGCP